MPASLHHLFSNRLLVLGIAAEIALIVLIDYTALGQAVFLTAPISPMAWLVPAPFAIALIAADSYSKRCQVRRRACAPTSGRA